MGGEGSGHEPRRRSVLALFGTSALLMAGCTRPRTPDRPAGATPRIPSPDELAAGRAATAAEALLDRESVLAASRLDLATVIRVVAVAHRAHLAALGIPASPISGSAPPISGSGSGSTSGSATPSGSSSSTPIPTAPIDVIRAEAQAAQQALADVEITTSGTAGLLARIAASRMVNADLLAAAAKLPAPGEPAVRRETSPSPASGSPSSSAGNAAAGPTTGPTVSPSLSPSLSPGLSPSLNVSPTGDLSGSSPSPTLDPTASAGLSQLLEAEHAAVFAYGLITARIPDSRREATRALWLAHRARRDELERDLAAAGVTPPAALPAYSLGAVPVTPAQIAALAARVEEGMAAAALTTVIATTGRVRRHAALDLVRAARRATAWSGTSIPLPG
jgi:hypothetical protein